METILGIEAKQMKPTKKHRLAFRMGILGTIFAINKEGKEEYFDYDYKAAKQYAGIVGDGKVNDVRVYFEDYWFVPKKKKAIYIID